jgi:hypothetical protein
MTRISRTGHGPEAGCAIVQELPAMSRIVDFPARRTSVRAAVLDLAPPLGPEEAEFLAALRRIVTRSPAERLWEKYHGSRADGRGRILARYAD